MARLKVYVVTTECVSDCELIMKDVNVYSLEYNAQKKKEDTIEQDFAPFIDGHCLYVKTDEKNLFLAKKIIQTKKSLVIYILCPLIETQIWQ